MSRRTVREESRLAFKRISTSKSDVYNAVLLAIAEAGDRGMTGKEVRAACGLPPQTQSARCCELRQCGLLKPTGARRDGSAVLTVDARHRYFHPLVEEASN